VTKNVLLLAAAVLALSTAPLAFADTVTIESYGTNLNDGSANTTPAGIANTAMTYNAGPTNSSAATFDIPTNAPWSSLTALSSTSSWVSFDAGTYVNGPTIAPAGNYIYHTTFTGAATDTGSITVLADDTTSVVFNGVTIVGQAADQAGVNCTTGTPNCLVATTYDLTGFTDGENILKFVVAQDFGSATGVDFVGTVTSTPEPSSLALLATGFLGAGGMLRSRFKKSVA
jgi:hypothetical protein